MKLQGNFEVMPLCDLIQWIATTRKTGTLKVKSGTTVKVIYFSAGNVVFSDSNHIKDRLGTLLVNRGIITEKQLQQTIAEQNKSVAKLCYLLVEKKLISQAKAVEILSFKTSEDIFDIFLWKSGKFIFTPFPLDNALMVNICLNPMNLVMEGMRRLDEWQRIRTSFKSDDVILFPGKVNLNNPDIDTDDLELIALVNGEHSLSEITNFSPLSLFEILSRLFKMYQQGIVRLPREEDEKTDRIIRKKLLEEIREARKSVNPTEALNIAENALLKYPDDSVVIKELKIAEKNYTDYIFSSLFSLEDTPKLNIPVDKLEHLDLDENEVFIITRIASGDNDISTILNLSPLKDTEDLRILKRLCETRIIVIE